MYQLSSAVLSAIAAVAKVDLLEPHQRLPECLIEGVLRLSDMFTRREHGPGVAYFEEPELRAAYLAYYLPVNLGKVQLLLDELQPVLSTTSIKEFRVLDIGGGPGTGALGLVDWCRSQSAMPASSLRMTVVDRSPQVLRLCEEVLKAYGEQHPAQPIVSLETVKCDLELSLFSALREVRKGDVYDLIIIQNCLSELFLGDPDFIGRRTTLVVELLNYLAAGGSLMLIEPAMRSASRSLHHLRDKLLAGQHCSVYSPCLHDAPCPALVKPDDWCHEERKWEVPAWIARVDREVGFIKDALKFSYVIMRKDGKTLMPRSENYHRVVSELRVMKGEKRVWLCDEMGRPEIGRQDKERSASNAPFDDWHRGAIVQISEIVRKDRRGRPAMVGRIVSSGKADVVRPA